MIFIMYLQCCFACVSLHIPILPFPPALSSIPRTFRFISHFPSQNPVEHARSSVLPLKSLPIPPMYFLFLPHFFLPYFPSFLYFPCLSRISPPKILLSMPAPGLLQRTSLYCSFYLDFPLLCFSSPSVLLDFSRKIYLKLTRYVFCFS